jgi:hypothetical protein
LFAAVIGECPRRQDVDRYTQQSTQFVADCANIHEGGGGRWFDEQIQVALIGVVTMQGRPENADLFDMVSQRDSTYRFAMCSEGLRGAHVCHYRLSAHCVPVYVALKEQLASSFGTAADLVTVGCLPYAQLATAILSIASVGNPLLRRGEADVAVQVCGWVLLDWIATLRSR